MTLAEDLLLLAVHPRNGSVHTVECLGSGLRAAELVELARARRVTCAEDRIAVIDPAPLGDPRLDAALTELRDRVPAPTLDAWLRNLRTRRPEPTGSLRQPGLVRQYLSDLVRAGVVRVDSPADEVSPSTRVVVLDAERRDRARAQIDSLVRGAPDTTLEDRALAVVVRACGLDQHLFPGLRGRTARQRLAGLGATSETTAGTLDAIQAADAALVDSVARALSVCVAELERQRIMDASRMQYTYPKAAQHHDLSADLVDNQSQPGHHHHHDGHADGGFSGHH